MEFEQLTSAQNPAIKHAVKLRDRRDRERERLTLLEGYRELSRGRAYGLTIREVFFAPEFFLGENEYPLLESLAAEGARVMKIPPFLLEKMAYRERPEGLIAVAEMREHTLAEIPLYPDGFYLVAEAVEKPGNLGSILRSADAAGVDGLIICDKGTDLYNPNVIRASTGALFSVPLAEATSREAFDWLKGHGIRTLAATPHATRLHTEVDLTGPVAIVVGTEQYGLSELWMKEADLPVRIPMLGKIDSLNVATAATILLYECARQRGWKVRGEEGRK